MSLSLPPLLAVGWLVTAFALPREVTTIRDVVVRTPEITRYTDIATPMNVTRTDMDGLRFESTDRGHLHRDKRNDDSQPPGGDNRCIFAKVKVTLADGKALWKTSDVKDSSKSDCDKYCVTKSSMTPDGVKFTSCFKNDNMPYVDEKGNEQSGP
jgi:hypothetical protein